MRIPIGPERGEKPQLQEFPILNHSRANAGIGERLARERQQAS
jgi:hypothetical protein